MKVQGQNVFINIPLFEQREKDFSPTAYYFLWMRKFQEETEKTAGGSEVGQVDFSI